MNKPRKFIDIVIPFNNEYLNLQILLPKILKTIKKIKYLKFRVILIDDGSLDKGPSLIKKFKKNNKNIFLIQNKTKSGQTFSYKAYFKKYKTEYFIRMDADNQDDPKHIVKISNYILKNYDLILTERKLRKHSPYMIILTYLYNKLLALLIKKKLKNYSSSLACFKRKYIPKTNLHFNDHRYFPIIAIDNGVDLIKSFPVIHKRRIHGFTKYGLFKKIFFALPEFIYFYYRLKTNCYKN
jgi:glycosyltransferase involved in cell wall biosynthesis